MESETKLLPCPFCQGRAYVNFSRAKHDGVGRDGFYVSCQRKSCYASTQFSVVRMTAIAAWNRRTQVTSGAGEVSEAEVEAALQASFGTGPTWRIRMGIAVRAEVLDGMRAALTAARRVQPKQDAPSPDVAR